MFPIQLLVCSHSQHILSQWDFKRLMQLFNSVCHRACACPFVFDKHNLLYVYHFKLKKEDYILHAGMCVVVFVVAVVAAATAAAAVVVVVVV